MVSRRINGTGPSLDLSFAPAVFFPLSLFSPSGFLSPTPTRPFFVAFRVTSLMRQGLHFFLDHWANNELCVDFALLLVLVHWTSSSCFVWLTLHYCLYHIWFDFIWLLLVVIVVVVVVVLSQWHGAVYISICYYYYYYYYYYYSSSTYQQ